MIKRFVRGIPLVIIGFLFASPHYIPDDVAKLILAIVAFISYIAWDIAYEKLRRKQL